MNIKKIAIAIIIFVILINNYTTTFAKTQPRLYSDGIYFANTTGQVLVSKNEDKKYQPGGIAKMIASLVALEKCNLADQVTVTEAAITKSETNASLKIGEILTVEDLVYCAIVANASDATKALAIHVSGSEAAFVKLMNEKARALGCENTLFTNSTGSNDDNQYTTPSDLFKLTIASINNTNLNTALRTSCRSIKKTNMSDERLFYSYNYLICAYYDNRYYYSNAQGGKSGYTPEGGYALAAFSTVGNTQLIAITMGGDDDKGVSTFNDTISLFKYGFNNYKSVSIATSGDILYEAKIKHASPSEDVILCAQHSLKALVKNDDKEYEFEKVFDIPDDLTPPVEKGQVLGNVTYLYDGKIVGTIPLIASEALFATSTVYIVNFFKFLWSFTITKIILIILGLILIIGIFFFLSILTGAVRIKKKPDKKKKLRFKYTKKE
ncbi:MAG: serine hydrolase [Eubacteriales bacterium]|nr:serine hydrolase [Eubacteriales bacterium]